MKKIIILLGFLGMAINAFSQRDMMSGFIIKNNGDTIYGKIDFQDDVYNSRHCSFKPDSLEEIKDYLPGQIKAYRFLGGKFYVSRKVTVDSVEKEVFLQYLVDGEIQLYYLPQKYYFIEKGNGKLQVMQNNDRKMYKDQEPYLVPSHQYIGVLKVYLRDCPELQKEINRASLKQKSLVKIATAYQNKMCPDKACVVYIKKRLKTQVRLGMILGLNYNIVHINLSEYYLTMKDWSPGPDIGLQVDLGSKDTHERLFFSAKLNYSQFFHGVTFLDPIGYSNVKIDFLTRNTSISVSTNYMYPHYRIKPYVGLGVTYCESIRDVMNVSTSYNHLEGIIGTDAILGVLYPINKKVFVKLCANYNYGTAYFGKYPFYGIAMNNFGILGSLQYSLGH